MTMTRKLTWALPAALLCTGCFTLSQTEMPQTTLTRAPEGRDVKVGVTGFAATVTDYLPVWGYETVWVDHGPYAGRRGGRMWGGGHYATVASETLVPQVRATQQFLQRAQTELEDAGYLVRATDPSYTVDVAFGGPFVRDGERAAEFAWMLCSVLSAEYATETWTAKLRVHDTKTGRLLLSRDYAQKYQIAVWSPIFFIGLSGCTENTPGYIQSWCLTALTDRALADATAFLASRK